jgi:23S rRNA (uracil1939-C5)-methyltransferase
VIPVAGTAFVQVNREVAGHIDVYVREQCGETTGKRIIDAYCGFGLRSLELARSGALVTGIERDRQSVRTAKRLAAQTDVQVRFEAGDVERYLTKALPADIVALNPPRGGLATAVIKTLMSSHVDRIIYVSCNPATLARDLRSLNPRFRLEALRAFDLFPQTAHVETVATLVP